ncbi:MAG: hypothetical protein LUO93_01720 [Methanomicrobiales archaeon]|nr:hypothetical protein [Methanomicrobiales archaeon]
MAKKKLAPKQLPNAGSFKPGHAKKGGRTKGTRDKIQIVEIPVPLERLSTVTETLKKYGVDPALEILKLLGMVPGVPEGWPLMKHQKAALLVQLMAMQKREPGGEPDPQTPDGSTGKKDIKAMSTDELLKRVLRATHDEQLQRTTGG